MTAAHRSWRSASAILAKRIQLQPSLRVLILVVVLAVALIGASVVYAVELGNSTHKLAVQNKQAQITGHAQRLADDAAAAAREDNKVDTLACFLVAQQPDSAAPIVAKFRKAYSCPAFGHDPNLALYPKVKGVPTAPLPPTGTYGSATNPGANGRVTIVTPTPTPGPTRTITKTVPVPTRTITHVVTPTPAPTPGPLGTVCDLSPAVCKLLNGK
ncbi:MAG: hypothetical protein M3O41_09355 [Pseudomonadota bacterium]|nr:hypothetical protein [Pseudomonadota bacterium]